MSALRCRLTLVLFPILTLFIIFFVFIFLALSTNCLLINYELSFLNLHPLLPLMYYPLSRTVYLHDVDQFRFLFHFLSGFIIFAFSFLTRSTNRPIRIFYVSINYLFPFLLLFHPYNEIICFLIYNVTIHFLTLAIFM